MCSLSSRLLMLLALFALGCAGARDPEQQQPEPKPAPQPEPAPAPEADDGASDVVIRVDAAYPGANGHVVRDTVAAPIEQQVHGVEGMTLMESLSHDDGSYTLTVHFTPKTNLADALVLVQNRLSVAEPQLPEEVRRQGVTVRKEQLARFRLWGATVRLPVRVQVALCITDDPDTKALHEWAEAVAKRLADDGIAVNPAVYPGRPTPHLHLDIDRVKLEKLGVTLPDVFAVLKGFTGNEPLVNDFNEFGRALWVKVRADHALTSADETKKLEVKTTDDKRVALDTFAAVHEMTLSPCLRVDLYPAIKITAAVPPGKSLAKVAETCVKIAEAQKPGKSYRVVNLTTTKPR